MSLLSVLGRQTAYRVGRALYLKARGDIANDMTSNGEMLVQQCAIQGFLRARRELPRLVTFDVGANIGDWSAALINRLASFGIGEIADVYVFEPVPSTAQSLRMRLGQPIHGLRYEQLALSSENGEGTIYVRGHNAGTNSLHLDSAEGGITPVKIEKATTTQFCNNRAIHKVHLLKCDTEGHDMEVIRGALPMLADGRISVLQFEYNHRWVYAGHFLRDAFAAIKDLPYKLAKLQPRFLLTLDEWHPELERFFEGNYAYIHNEALGWFPIRRVSWDRHNAMRIQR